MSTVFTNLDLVGGRSTGTRIVFQQVESENPLPETKKEWLRKGWQTIVDHALDGLFEDPIQLSAQDSFKTTQTPVDSAHPIPAVTAENGAIVEEVMRKRSVLTAENARKQAYHDRIVKEGKTALGASLLNALEINAPTTAEQMRNAAECVLVAATDAIPAKYDGVAMWKAYAVRKGLNDATRQDNEAEALFKELSVFMPENCTATQMGQLVSKYMLKVKKFMLRPLTDEMEVEWILSRMPKTGPCAAARVHIIAMLRDQGKTGDGPSHLLRSARADESRALRLQRPHDAREPLSQGTAPAGETAAPLASVGPRPRPRAPRRSQSHPWPRATATGVGATRLCTACRPRTSCSRSAPSPRRMKLGTGSPHARSARSHPARVSPSALRAGSPLPRAQPLAIARTSRAPSLASRSRLRPA